MRKILRNLYLFFIFIYGRFLSLFLYNRKYLKSKWFKGKKYFFDAPGWQWVVIDFHSRIFLRVNNTVPFPISPFCNVVDYRNIFFEPDELNIFQSHGSYFQSSNGAKIVIGKNVWIGPNVGIIGSNHDLKDPSRHQEGKDVIIGDNCWIGMNSVLLPGVTLGKNTVVGAGSIVTKSFPEGNIVIVGNPARKIRNLPENLY